MLITSLKIKFTADNNSALCNNLEHLRLTR